MTRHNFCASNFEPLEARTLLSVSVHSHHFHHQVAHPSFNLTADVTYATPPATAYTPAAIRHAYGWDNVTFNNGAISGDGSGQTIAIVDAYDDPNIVSDLAAFDYQFGLPGQTTTAVNGFFRKVAPRHTHADGSGGWALETALDVEWAHAMAPGAKIVLVEAASSSLSNLLTAVDTARRLSDVSVVSMSWGGSDFSGESAYDSYFTALSGHQPITFAASSGDSGARVEWPSVSANVMAVGGTKLLLDSNGNYYSAGETGWSGSGGGVSNYEKKPAWQNTGSVFTNGFRSTPDVAYDADPNTGFAVYDSVPYSGVNGWFQVGGTSASAPQWAALVAVADQGRALGGKSTLGTTTVLADIYNGTVQPAHLHDIIGGSNGYSATSGYDLVTGKGSPFSDQVIADLLA